MSGKTARRSHSDELSGASCEQSGPTISKRHPESLTGRGRLATFLNSQFLVESLARQILTQSQMNKEDVWISCLGPHNVAVPDRGQLTGHKRPIVDANFDPTKAETWRHLFATGRSELCHLRRLDGSAVRERVA